MADALTIDFSEPVALFPLPRTLLLPHATVPLHIFEARYRAMVEDALENQALIAMAVFDGEQWKSDYEGTPPLREHVCLGVIRQHHRLPDGRFHLLLQGVCRARIVREVGDAPYRQAMLMPTETSEVMEIDLADHRRRLEALLDTPELRDLAAVSTLRPWLQSDLPTAAALDLIALSLCQEDANRYHLLAETDPVARAEWLESHLRQTRDTLELANRIGPSVTEDGINLN
ncbi:MAG: LON peptidase substrate-binding domain-containing protein [Phycisphaeraceae bacterium]